MARLLVFLLLMMSGPAMAGTSDLRSLMTGDDSKGWEAVGRLNIGGKAFCTGSLIAENLVLTAAHCMFDAETGEQFAADTVEFLAGWRNGRAAAYRSGRRVALHPSYDFHAQGGAERAASDVALIELDQPIRTTNVTPYVTADWPLKGVEVGVVSYAHDRAEMPSLQETCEVLGQQLGTLVLTCNVDRGSSGAPIFVLEDGEARIVSVVSAKAHAGEQPVSLGTSLGVGLEAMKSQLAESDGMFTRVTPTQGLVSRADGGAAGSAKFLRPGG